MPSRDDNLSKRRKSKNRSNSSSRQNTFRPQKSVTQSPAKKFSRGQSTRKSSSKERPKFAPKAGFAQCSICSRNFAPERIGKHKEICAKSTRTRRKVFDVSASRVEGTEAAQFQGVKVGVIYLSVAFRLKSHLIFSVVTILVKREENT